MKGTVDKEIISSRRLLDTVRRERVMLISLAILMIVNITILFGYEYHNQAGWSGTDTQFVASYSFWTALSLYAFRRVHKGLGHRVMLVLLLTMTPCAFGVLLLVGFVVWWRVWVGIPYTVSFIMIFCNWLALVVIEIHRRSQMRM